MRAYRPDPLQITVRLWRTDHAGELDLSADEFRDLFSVCQHQARLVGVVCPGYSLPAVSYTNVGI